MKKIAIAIILFCTLYSAYSLDYRQVIFGNSYRNIIEIDADSFFEQYPAVKGTESGGTTYARVYEQIIGESTFYRVLFSDEKLSEADFLDWKNTNFIHFIFFKKSNTNLLQFGGYAVSYEFRRIDYNDNPVYTGLEIIERNNQVIGLMEYTLSESDSSNNEAIYSSWQNILNAEEEWEESPTISYATDNGETTRIVASNSLIDSKRPFMYTIQNAFDGNPATSYVENTEDDMFLFEIWLYGWDYGKYPECTGYKIINGYASGDYYYQNNQIAKVAIFSTGTGKDKSYYTHDSFQLHDTIKPQVMNFKAMTMYRSESVTLHMEVEELTNGTRYNDTAIAEFDLYIENEGWLFGSSDTDTVVALPTTANEYEYTIKDDGTAEIKRYNWEDTKVTIPSIIDYRDKTYTVTSIGASAFSDCLNLTSITLPNSVTTIGNEAFARSGLISITIPNNVTSVGVYAFSDCSNLTSITIPDSLTTIGDMAFSGCFNLTSITIPDSVTSIGSGAFEYTGLTSITIPNSVTSIESWTFSNCKSLTSITISDNVTSIEAFAFSNTGLTSITIPSNVTSIGDWAFNTDNLTVSVYPDSYALEYVQENDIPYILIN